MKFKITSTWNFGVDRYKHVLDKYNLEKYNMNKSLEIEAIETIELASLEELIKMQSELGQEIIITGYKCCGMPEIEIYDDYRE